MVISNSGSCPGICNDIKPCLQYLFTTSRDLKYPFEASVIRHLLHNLITTICPDSRSYRLRLVEFNSEACKVIVDFLIGDFTEMRSKKYDRNNTKFIEQPTNILGGHFYFKITFLL